MKQFMLYVRHDLRNGIVAAWRKYLIALVMFGILCGSLYSGFLYLHNSPRLAGIDPPTFADYLFYVMRGMTWFKSPEQNFSVDVLWFAIHLFLAYVVSFYPFKDLGGYGQQMLFHSQRRNIWWLCKCVWNMASVTLFYGTLFLAAFVFSLFTGTLSLEITPNIQSVFSQTYASMQPNEVILYVMILPWVTSMAISLMQMMFALAIHPLAGILAVCVVLTVSVFSNAYFLPGNNLMLIRCCLFWKSTGQFEQGMLTAIGIAVLSVVIGLIVFRKKDIFSIQT